MTDEEYVRSRWKYTHRIMSHVVEPGTHRIEVGEGGQNAKLIVKGAHSTTEAWHAAAEFTRERERQIAEIRSEIDEVKEWVESSRDMAIQAVGNGDAHIAGIGAAALFTEARILGRLQSQLAELRRGMKEQEGERE